MLVNLGDDTDTIAAIAGGLAGLYYGYDDIPDEWISALMRSEWILRYKVIYCIFGSDNEIGGLYRRFFIY